MPRQPRLVALALAGAVALIPGCAKLLNDPPSDWDCPMFPPGWSEHRDVTQPLELSASEALARMDELERYIWFDTPSGIYRDEFATWGEKTKVEEVRCLRARGDGTFKHMFVKDGALVSLPAESFASIGGSAFRFETPVVIRTGKRLVISYATTSPDYSSERAPYGQTSYAPGEGRIAVERGRAFMSIDLAGILPDDPDGYRYLVDKDEGRWALDTGYASVIAMPTRGRELDPSRAGYVVTVVKDAPHLEVREIRIRA